MHLTARTRLGLAIAGAWLLAPAADFREVGGPVSATLFLGVVLTWLGLILCGWALACAAGKLHVSAATVGVVAVGELLVLSVLEIAAVRLFWGEDTAKYLVFRESVGWTSAILIAVILTPALLRRLRSGVHAGLSLQPVRWGTIVAILVLLIVSGAVAYGFALLRTYAFDDGIVRTARAAESVFLLGFPTLLVTTLIVWVTSRRATP